MKKTFLHLPFATLMSRFLILCFIGPSGLYANPSTTPGAVAKDSSKDSIVVSVQGMVCDFCAQGLKKSFIKKAPVDSIHVSLDQGVVVIYPQEGQSISEDFITKGIRDNGISVESIQRTPLVDTP